MLLSPATTRLTLARLALVSMLIMSTSACRSLAPMVVRQVTHDSLYQAVMQYDSISITHQSTEQYRASAFRFDTVMNAYLKVDTIFRDRMQTQFRYRWLHDTTYVHKSDTIPKVITVTRVRYRWPPGTSPALTAFILLLMLIFFMKNAQKLVAFRRND